MSFFGFCIDDLILGFSLKNKSIIIGLNKNLELALSLISVSSCLINDSKEVGDTFDCSLMPFRGSPQHDILFSNLISIFFRYLGLHVEDFCREGIDSAWV